MTRHPWPGSGSIASWSWIATSIGTRRRSSPKSSKTSTSPIGGQKHSRARPGISSVSDPRFVDAAQDDFHLHPDSPALSLGFVPFDYEAAGRTTTPSHVDGRYAGSAEGIRMRGSRRQALGGRRVQAQRRGSQENGRQATGRSLLGGTQLKAILWRAILRFPTFQCEIQHAVLPRRSDGVARWRACSPVWPAPRTQCRRIFTFRPPGTTPGPDDCRPPPRTAATVRWPAWPSSASVRGLRHDQPALKRPVVVSIRGGDHWLAEPLRSRGR